MLFQSLLKIHSRNLLRLLFVTFLSTFSTSVKAGGGIVPDNTLGTENSVVNPISPQLDQITGGATRGNSLFHSFSDFNIDAGKIAEFSNQPGIQNIFSRVTGTDPSNIMGTLRVNGNSNLYFINPNGIVFGQGSQLDMRGSFVATTANRVNFPGGQSFSATNPQLAPILTVDVPAPIGVEFDRTPAPISFQDSTISVGQGKTIGIIGGRIDASNSTIRAVGGKIDIISVSAPSRVGVNVSGDRINITPSPNSPRGDISIGNQSLIDTSGDGGGAINIWGRSLSLDRGKIFSVTDSRIGENISINISRNVTLTNHSTINSNVRNNGIGGNIVISAGNISLDNSLLTSVGDTGTNGSISLTSQSSISLSGDSLLQTVSSTGRGKQGIVVNTPLLSLDESTIETAIQNNVGENESPGNIALNIENLLLMRNGSQISSNGFSNEDGGYIEINSPRGFVVASPNGNNDIIATAVGGRGGTVNISNATKIFGIQRRDLKFNAARGNSTNDISSSSFSGDGNVFAPSFLVLDPSRGLAKISEDIPRISLIEGCQTNAGNEPVRFYPIGLGGKPPEPGESTNTDTYLIDWTPLNFSMDSNTARQTQPSRRTAENILSSSFEKISLCQRNKP
jgi:filamentous hemagglutinin family protein